MNPESLTREKLFELESIPKTKVSIIKDYLICLLPVLTGIVCLIEYYLVPNYEMNSFTNVYGIFRGVPTAVLFIIFLVSLLNNVSTK